jgi:hypothetical protein
MYQYKINTLKTDNCPLKTKKSYELPTKNYELENNLANLINLNKIMVQTSNGPFGIIKERLAFR